MNFGENLKNAIKSRGFDIDEIAIQIDVEAATLYGYTQNIFLPQFDNLCEICIRFSIPPNELFDSLYDFNHSEANQTFKILYLLNTLSPEDKIIANKIIEAFINHLEHKELKNLGTRIKYLRKYNKMTAKKLADKVNLADTSIRNIESNTAQPSVSSFLEFADALHVSPNYLLADRINIPSEKRFSKLFPNEIALLYSVLATYFN